MPRRSSIRKHDLGTEVLRLRMEGKTHREIAAIINREHGLVVSRRSISRYFEGLSDTDREATRDRLIFEINQTGAKEGFMNHLAELNRRYTVVRDSKDTTDRQEATSILRLLDSAIEKYLRVTGLYDRAGREAGKLPDPRSVVIESDRRELDLIIEILEHALKDHPEVKIDLSRALLERRR